MSLEEKYPKIFSKLEDKEVELRHLLNIDENYEDYDSEEFEYDFKDYNYILYIAEPIVKILEQEKMKELIERVNRRDEFTNFLASEIDLYAVWSEVDEEKIASILLDTIEELV